MNTHLEQDLFHRLDSLATAQYLLVCTDYDGTLAPLASRPEEARMLPGAFTVLHDLANLPFTRVAIISGRSLGDLRNHSGLDSPVLLVGSHGAELPVNMNKEREVHGKEYLDAIESMLVSLCLGSPGSWVERKPLGMAVHVRQASRSDQDRLLEQVRDCLSEWPLLHVTEGKAIIELSVSSADKGDAVRWLCDEWGSAPQVIYLGDDVTDEAAFKALRASDLGVKVGSAPSCAKFRVSSEEAVLGILMHVFERRSLMRHEVHTVVTDLGRSMQDADDGNQ